MDYGHYDYNVCESYNYKIDIALMGFYAQPPPMFPAYKNRALFALTKDNTCDYLRSKLQP
jgi:hypothetical protein